MFVAFCAGHCMARVANKYGDCFSKIVVVVVVVVVVVAIETAATTIPQLLLLGLSLLLLQSLRGENFSCWRRSFACVTAPIQKPWPSTGFYEVVPMN